MELAVDECSADDVLSARRPIDSLMSKSEKALRKLTPGTWQHAMLRDNVAALKIASRLMNQESSESGFAPDDLHGALTALASMASRTEKALGKFAPGTSQHSLQRNRLKALRIAEVLIKAELEEKRPAEP